MLHTGGESKRSKTAVTYIIIFIKIADKNLVVFHTVRIHDRGGLKKPKGNHTPKRPEFAIMEAMLLFIQERPGSNKHRCVAKAELDVGMLMASTVDTC